MSVKSRQKFKPYQQRLFLNEDLLLPAYIIADVPEKEIDEKGSEYSYPTLTISDCSRKIELEFSYWGKDEKEKVKKKAKLFRKTINDFFDALEAEINRPIEYVKTNKTKSTN